MEAERKRQKLKEITLGEPEVSVEDETPTSEMTKTKRKSANLLDMLRQSSISAPPVPVIQTPPPKPAKPQAALGNDLLNALRSSVSQSVDNMEEVILHHNKIRVSQRTKHQKNSHQFWCSPKKETREQQFVTVTRGFPKQHKSGLRRSCPHY